MSVGDGETDFSCMSLDTLLTSWWIRQTYITNNLYKGSDESIKQEISDIEMEFITRGHTRRLKVMQDTMRRKYE